MDQLFCKIINVINAAVNLKLYCIVGDAQRVHVKKCLRDYIFVPHSYDLSCMKLRESLGVLKSLKIILKKKFYFSY